MADGTLTGLLLDVSGSMKENATGSVDEEGEWVRSLFQVSLRVYNAIYYLFNMFYSPMVCLVQLF